MHKILLPLLVLALFAIPHPLFDADFGTHYRAGEWICQNGDVPRSDTTSYTLPGFPVIDHEWLQDLMLYGSYSLAGFSGVRVYYGLLAVLLVVPLFGALLPRELPWEVRRFATLILTISLIVGRLWRQQIVSLIGFALLLLIVRRVQQDRSSRFVWLLPLLFLFWVNLHGAFLLGLLLLTLMLVLEWWGSRDRGVSRSLVGATALSWLVTLLNPYGARIYDEIIRTGFSRGLQTKIIEWSSPVITEPRGELFFLCAGLAAVPYLLRRIRPDLMTVAITALLFALGLSSQRHVMFFIFWVLVNLLRDLPRFGFRINDRLKAAERRLFAVTAIGTVVYLLTLPWSGFSAEARLEKIYPVHAVTALTEAVHGREADARIFQQLSWGGYLVWRNPALKTFIDGRMVFWTRDGESILEQYLKVVELQPGWEAILERHGVNIMLLPAGAALTHELRKHPDKWAQIYRDDFAEIYRSSVSTALIRSSWGPVSG